MFVLLVLVAVVTFLIWYLSKPFYWRKRNVPYLVPLPIIGNYFQMFTNGTVKTNYELYNNFPGERFYGLHVFTKPILLVKDPELIQRILVKDFEYFTSHGLYSNQDRDPAGSNLFHIHGQQWKEIRQKLNVYFTPAKIRSMLTIVDKSYEKGNSLIQNNINEKKPVNIADIIFKITIDVTTRTIFGVESDVFENDNSIFSELAEEMFSPKLTSKLFLSMVSPKIFDFMKLCLFGEKSSNLIADIIKKTVDYRSENNVILQDFVQGMMNLMEKNGLNSEKKYFPDKTRVPVYDLKTLVAQAIILYAAGVETTALTMIFFLYEMSIHPEMQDKCRKEINAISNETGKRINIADISKLTYLNAAIQETLRLYAPVTALSRECTKEYRIPDSNVVLEPGTMVQIITAAHMDPKYYAEPEKFRPERFLNGNIIKNGTFYPFGLGPRICLGMSFALNEMKLVLSRFIQEYEFSINSKSPVPIEIMKYKFLRTPNGLWLNIHRTKCDF